MFNTPKKAKASKASPNTVSKTPFSPIKRGCKVLEATCADKTQLESYLLSLNEELAKKRIFFRSEVLKGTRFIADLYPTLLSDIATLKSTIAEVEGILKTAFSHVEGMTCSDAVRDNIEVRKSIPTFGEREDPFVAFFRAMRESSDPDASRHLPKSTEFGVPVKKGTKLDF